MSPEGGDTASSTSHSRATNVNIANLLSPCTPRLGQGPDHISTTIDKLAAETISLVFELVCFDGADVWEAAEECQSSSATDRLYTSPVKVAACLSHVCGEWRGIIIGMSCLWSRIIDTSFFGEKQIVWWNVVVERARQAPIWLRCYDDTPRNSTSFSTGKGFNRVKDFILPLLLCPGKRFAKIDLKIENSLQFMDPRWKKIKVLNGDITFFRLRVNDSIRAQTQQAPNFHHDYAIETAFAGFATWDTLANLLHPVTAPPSLLASLCLGGIAQSLDSLLGALRQMPRLQSLRLIECDIPSNNLDAPQKLPQIALPMLTELEIIDMLATATLLLPRIMVTGSFSCRLVIKSQNASDSTLLNISSKVVRDFANCVQKWVQTAHDFMTTTNERSTISWEATDLYFSIQLYRSDSFAPPSKPDIVIQLQSKYSLNDLNGPLKASVISSILSCSFSSVSRVRMHWGLCLEMSSTVYPYIRRFLRRAKSISQIVSQHGCLTRQVILDALSDGEMILPQLVGVTYYITDDIIPGNAAFELATFVNSLKANGRTLQRLNLLHHGPHAAIAKDKSALFLKNIQECVDGSLDISVDFA